MPAKNEMNMYIQYLKVRLVIGFTLINYNISVLYIFWTENKNSIIVFHVVLFTTVFSIYF
jgi:hypothetical protein